MGLVTGPRACIPGTHSQWVVGPAARPNGRAVGVGRALNPGHRTHRQEAPPPGALVPPPQRAKPARKSARCGFGDGSPRRHPPHPVQLVVDPPPHALKDDRSGVGERPTPDAPHPGKRRSPLVPSCRPHSVQSQLVRARAVGLVTGPHAHTPRTHSQWVVPRCRKPQRTIGRGWESARPRTPHTQATGAPPRRPRAAPTARNASLQERALQVGDGSPRPPPPHPQPVGSGPRPHVSKDGRWGVGERATPDAPRQSNRRPPQTPSCCPHSVQSRLARTRAVGFVTGPHACTPRSHSHRVAGPGSTPQSTSGPRWESATTRTPHTQARGAPLGALVPRPQRAKRARKARAVGLLTGPHAHAPRIHSQWVVGPGRTPQSTIGRGWESA